MSAIHEIINLISSLSFSNGRIDHKTIKSQQDERNLLWIFTLIYLGKKNVYPSSTESSNECANGVSSMRFCCGQIVNFFFKFVSDLNTAKGATGTSYYHSPQQIQQLRSEIASHAETDGKKIHANLLLMFAMAIEENVYDENFFKNQMSRNLATGKFFIGCFPLFNMNKLFINWDKKRFTNVANVPQPEEPQPVNFVLVHPAYVKQSNGLITVDGTKFSDVLRKNLDKKVEVVQAVETPDPFDSEAEALRKKIASMESTINDLKDQIEKQTIINEKKRQEKTKIEQIDGLKNVCKETEKLLENTRKDLQRLKNEKI